MSHILDGVRLRRRPWKLDLKPAIGQTYCLLRLEGPTIKQRTLLFIGGQSGRADVVRKLGEKVARTSCVVTTMAVVLHRHFL